MFRPLRELTATQRSTVLASFLGWTLDAFDFFILIFVIKDIARDLLGGDSKELVKQVAFATTLTLAMRPVGALIFGVMADRIGRRPTLMIDIIIFSVVELLTAFAPSLTVLLVLRAIYGIAMGGEWGVGASLTMESIPVRARGVVSGLLQEGYAVGYLLAAIVYGLFFSLVGWRGLFVIGALPAFLVLYIRMKVPESPAWERTRHVKVDHFAVIREQWPLFIYTIVLMTAFNFFSHGTQDLYPTFLQLQHNLSPHAVSIIAIIYNIGAIVGGITFGAWSERLGRRRAIIIAALLALPIIPLWALSANVVLLAVGAFLMQFMVQGAWGVIPTHLNELSPDSVRGTFPGFTYQLGNLFASYNLPLQVGLATGIAGSYGGALAIVAAVVAVAIIVITGLGKERKGVAFGTGTVP